MQLKLKSARKKKMKLQTAMNQMVGWFALTAVSVSVSALLVANFRGRAISQRARWTGMELLLCK